MKERQQGFTKMAPITNRLTKTRGDTRMQRRLEEERPFETAPRTTRLSTQHRILCLRAHPVRQVFHERRQRGEFEHVHMIGSAESVPKEQRPIGGRNQRGTCTARRRKFHRRRRGAPAESDMFPMFFSKVAKRPPQVFGRWSHASTQRGWRQ